MYWLLQGTTRWIHKVKYPNSFQDLTELFSLLLVYYTYAHTHTHTQTNLNPTAFEITYTKSNRYVVQEHSWLGCWLFNDFIPLTTQ
jgi:hypothetical protein